MVFVVVIALQAIPTQAYPVSGWTRIYEGIERADGMATSPRLMRAYALRVSLRNPDISIVNSSGNGGSPYDTNLQGTDAFLGTYSCKVGVNCCHWDVNTPPPYADVLGLLIYQGGLVSSAGGIWPTQLNFSSAKNPWLVASNDPPVGCWMGVETGPYVLANGVVQPYAPAINPYTGLGISQDNKYLIMVCVDGRQPGWSDGCTYAELGQWLKDFGAWNGVHVDGGGSTCMARADIGVVNRPCYGYVRQVAVSIGAQSTACGVLGPSACAVSSSRIDVATRGNLNHLTMNTWTSAGGWSGPVDLNSGLTYDQPAMVKVDATHQMAFYRGSDNKIWYKTWTNGTWGGESNFATIAYGAPTACARDANTICVCYRGGNNSVWSRTMVNGVWSGESNPGGITYDSPTICSRDVNHMDLFYKGQDNRVWLHRWANGVWEASDVCIGGIVTSAPTVCSRDANHMDVVYRGQDNAVWIRSWANGTWSPSDASLGGGGNVSGRPNIVAVDSTRMDVFYRSNNDHLWQRTWTSSSGWFGWADLGAIF